MAAGFIDLDVRYIDPITVKGVAVDDIHGIVKNAVGTQVDDVIPDPYSDDDGTYYSVKDYDVRDASKFAGFFVTVDWITTKGGIILPTFSKQYDYQPVSIDPANKTVIYWDPPTVCGDKDIMFYEIYREKDDGTKVLAGRSVSPCFVDKAVFANEFEARAWNYRAYAYYLTKGSLQPDGSDYLINSSPIVPTSVSRTGLDLCLVEGRVTDVTGTPIHWTTDRDKDFINFFMDWKDRHSYVGDRGMYVSPQAVTVHLTTQGEFAAALVQDVVVTLIVEWLGLKARFVVPRKDHAFINELNMEISKTW